MKKLVSIDVIKVMFMVIAFAAMTAIGLNYEKLFDAIGVYWTILVFFANMTIIVALISDKEEG